MPHLARSLGPFLLSTAVLSAGGLLGSCSPTVEVDDFVENEDFYGPCEDDLGRITCKEDTSVCDYYPDPSAAEYTVCTVQCMENSDCMVPKTGNPNVTCSGASAACTLGCSGGETCPDEMICVPAGICMWPEE